MYSSIESVTTASHDPLVRSFSASFEAGILVPNVSLNVCSRLVIDILPCVDAIHSQIRLKFNDALSRERIIPPATESDATASCCLIIHVSIQSFPWLLYYWQIFYFSPNTSTVKEWLVIENGHQRLNLSNLFNTQVIDSPDLFYRHKDFRGCFDIFKRLFLFIKSSSKHSKIDHSSIKARKINNILRENCLLKEIQRSTVRGTIYIRRVESVTNPSESSCIDCVMRCILANSIK